MGNLVGKYKAIRGMCDILPSETPLWQRVEKTAHSVFGRSGYGEIRTPIVEKVDLFTRSVGESTAIVEKEMYNFIDKGEDRLCLRPEATASVVRAFIESGLANSEPTSRFYYMGPMFRRERPQKGRQRQFHQIGIELFGVDNPLADVEIISTFTHLLDELKIEDVKLELNSIGCSNCRPKFNKDLIKFLESQCDSLCEDCKRRIVRNPMRAFDCKEEKCLARLKSAPKISNYWCEECTNHFEGVKNGLAKLDIPFVLNEWIVRGLDYYIRTAFEFTTTKLGSQSAVAAGGRYDGLVKSLGGPDIPGVGYAIGLERLILLVKEAGREEISKDKIVYFAVLGEKVALEIMDTVHALRAGGVHVEWDFGLKSLKAQMRRADKLGASSVVIIGEDELSKGIAIVRDMKSKEQKEVVLSDLGNFL